MSFVVPNIFKKQNHTLENFYRYSFLFFSFLFLYIAISIKAVYIPLSRISADYMLSSKGLEALFWACILLFLDSFVSGVMYKRHVFYGIWRYRNAMIGFYLVAVLVICSLFIFNYIFY